MLTINPVLPVNAVTPWGLIIPEETTIDQWIKIGGAFNRADDLLSWYIGDWIVFGKQHVGWGDRYTRALEATGIEYHTLSKYASISNAVPIISRNRNLSYSHHAEVARLPTDQQIAWLSCAEAEKLTVRELSTSIAAGHLMRTIDIDATTRARRGLYTPHAVRSIFTRALRQVTGRIPVERWSPAMRTAWKEELKPIAELYAKL